MTLLGFNVGTSEAAPSSMDMSLGKTEKDFQVDARQIQCSFSVLSRELLLCSTDLSSSF
jgi:hypothetical protein